MCRYSTFSSLHVKVTLNPTGGAGVMSTVFSCLGSKNHLAQINIPLSPNPVQLTVPPPNISTMSISSNGNSSKWQRVSQDSSLLTLRVQPSGSHSILQKKLMLGCYDGASMSEQSGNSCIHLWVRGIGNNNTMILDLYLNINGSSVSMVVPSPGCPAPSVMLLKVPHRWITSSLRSIRM